MVLLIGCGCLFTLEVSPEPTGNNMQTAKQDAHKRFRQKTLSLCVSVYTHVCAGVYTQAGTDTAFVCVSAVVLRHSCVRREVKVWPLDTQQQLTLSSHLSSSGDETWEKASWHAVQDWSRLCGEEVTCWASVTFKEVFWQLWYDLSLWHMVSSLSHQIGYPVIIESTKTTRKLQCNDNNHKYVNPT